MARLTNKSSVDPTKLNSHLRVPFSLCFREKLFNGYTFKELKKEQLRDWQKFLDIVSQLTFEQVERRYRRDSDTTDTYGGEQIIHYWVSESFRVHGVIQNAQFVVLRLDPNHRVHRS